MIRYISNGWNQIPKAVRLFFLRATVLFIVWKCIYLFLLLPGRVLDQPLTYSVGDLTTKTLNILNPSRHYSVKSIVDTFEVDGIMHSESQMQIYLNKESTLGIADVCNGLELFILYAGFIVCFPSSISRKVSFILVGSFLIYVLNIARCAALVLIFVNYNAYLDFSHHFIFNSIVYAFIFLLWYFFSKNLRLNVRPHE